MKESDRSPGILVNAIWNGQFKNESLLQAVAALGSHAQRALYLRFWENYDIQEISEALKISWDQADQLIESSLATLKAKLSSMKFEERSVA